MSLVGRSTVTGLLQRGHDGVYVAPVTPSKNAIALRQCGQVSCDNVGIHCLRQTPKARGVHENHERTASVCPNVRFVGSEVNVRSSTRPFSIDLGASAAALGSEVRHPNRTGSCTEGWARFPNQGIVGRAPMQYTSIEKGSVGPAPGVNSPTEIVAPARSVVRYCPNRPLPPYRFVPGLHPHPTRHPAGHSYAPAAPLHGRAAWDPSAWRTLDDWLSGVDRFNTFYFWEAHEAWEGLWAAVPRDSRPARTLQGLIQIAAALLKIHLGIAAWRSGPLARGNREASRIGG